MQTNTNLKHLTSLLRPRTSQKKKHRGSSYAATTKCTPLAEGVRETLSAPSVLQRSPASPLPPAAPLCIDGFLVALAMKQLCLSLCLALPQHSFLYRTSRPFSYPIRWLTAVTANECVSTSRPGGMRSTFCSQPDNQWTAFPEQSPAPASAFESAPAQQARILTIYVFILK